MRRHTARSKASRRGLQVNRDEGEAVLAGVFVIRWSHLAFGAETRIEIERARISIMARSSCSTNGPDTEAQDQSPPLHYFWLATHGRSIQMGHEHASDDKRRHVRSTPLQRRAASCDCGPTQRVQANRLQYRLRCQRSDSSESRSLGNQKTDNCQHHKPLYLSGSQSAWRSTRWHQT